MSRAPEPLVPLPEEEEGEPLDHMYRRHAGWLRVEIGRRFGRAVRTSAEDLVQETYLRAAAVRAHGPVRHPRALLLTIASRLAIDLVRAKRREALALAQPREAFEAPTQDAGLLLRAAILGLPPRLRDVFLLSRYDGLTYGEIASRLGLSVKTVEARMTEALRRLTATLRT